VHRLGEPLDFLQRLWELNHALERVSAEMERTLGVTAQQRLVLRCVGKFPGMTMGELARVLHLDPGTVSASVRRLEARGLVARRGDPRDGRRVCLGLTRAGRSLGRPSARTVEHAVIRLIEECSPADLVVTKTVLGTLTLLLDAEMAEA
jgi:DNA-binding MarR family transcriptional regulator